MPDKTKKLPAKLVAWREELKAPMPTKNTGQNPPAKAGKRAKRQNKKAEAD